jgi:hypothetical protein
VGEVGRESESHARRIFSKECAQSLDVVVDDAVDLKYTVAALTKAQLDEFIEIPPS